MTTDGLVRSFVDRVLRLKEEQDALASDIREVYAEAKSAGLDKTALGKVVDHVRRVAKDPGKVAELEAVIQLYLDAYHREPSHAHAREEAA
jgi:uncharacterized protein (UPF0335 family)